MKTPRRGFTLIEMLLMLVLIGTAMGTMAMTLHAIYGADRRVRAALDCERHGERFAQVFRRDVHGADAAQVDAAAKRASLSLSLPQRQTITYTLGSRGIERVVASGDAVLHREVYRFPPMSATWEVDSQRATPLVSLRMAPIDQARDGLSLRQGARIAAAVGIFRKNLAAIAAPPKKEGGAPTEKPGE